MILYDQSIIEPTLRELKANFQTHKTKSVQFRKQQLRQLLFGIQELKHEFFLAIQKDLGYQDEFQFQLQHYNIMLDAVKHFINNVEEYAKIRRVSTNMIIGPGKSYIVPDPLGVALIIGAWNYPYKIAIEQVALCIAAGNAIVLKPSEMAPQSSSTFVKLFNNYLDKQFYRVIEGGIEIAANITKHPFDLIIFTGSPEKGKLVAKAAAENLIPCILELGGKCPVIVDGTNDLGMAARRISQIKGFNIGQTCVAPDYVLVDAKVRDQLIEQLKIAYKQFFSDKPEERMNRFINEFHARRVQSYLTTNGGQIVYGGKYNLQDKWVEPTIVLNPSKDSDMMKNEIFGPILPVVEYKTIDEAIQYINSNHKPLALYYFGASNENKEKIINQTQSGGICINDCMFHSVNPELPFGGVGNSGYGYINGKIGFDNCVHLKIVLEKNSADIFQQRYPPYNESKRKFLNFLFKYGDYRQDRVLTGLATIIVIFLILSGLFLRNALGSSSSGDL